MRMIKRRSKKYSSRWFRWSSKGTSLWILWRNSVSRKEPKTNTLKTSFSPEAVNSAGLRCPSPTEARDPRAPPFLTQALNLGLTALKGRKKIKRLSSEFRVVVHICNLCWRKLRQRFAVSSRLACVIQEEPVSKNKHLFIGLIAVLASQGSSL